MSSSDQQSGIYLTRSGPARTVVIGAACPEAMLRPGVWRVDDYELHKQLYKGKASLLYSATCRKSGEHVALKLYRKPRLSDLNWFQVNREIQLHSVLKHENIIDFYAAFEDVDNVYLVQEYAHGGDLYGELKRCGGRFKDKNVAQDILLPCMLALQYCHHKGIIHRDIKPENILLTKHRKIRLADFGLSINAELERPVTRAGTLDYMAPEVLTCPEKSRPEENKDKAVFGYTSAVDAWAMGILAFECLSGKPPFECATRTETYEHIMYKKHVCPTYFAKEAADFILKALSKAPTKRCSITDLLTHPWIAQYHLNKDGSQIAAFYGGAQTASTKSDGEAPTSVLNSGQMLSGSGSGEADASRSNSMAETIRPAPMPRTQVPLDSQRPTSSMSATNVGSTPLQPAMASSVSQKGMAGPSPLSGSTPYASHKESSAADRHTAGQPAVRQKSRNSSGKSSLGINLSSSKTSSVVPWPTAASANAAQ